MTTHGAPAVEAGMVRHPRGTWIDPTTGEGLDHHHLMRRMATKRAVLLGETHDVAEIHRWQLHVAAFLHVHQPRLALGFEMFPRRVQPVLDEWVAGGLSTEAFLEKVAWKTVWGFDPGLYLPLFHFCRQMGVPMLALNCHRPLVTRVGKEGWEAIPVAERDGLTPAKPATRDYRRYLFDIIGGNRPDRPPGSSTSADDPKFDRFVRAQQTWDRAFACNIAAALTADPGQLVVGIIGRGHLEYGHGTPFQLRDLGIDDLAVLLPSEAAESPAAPGLADAVFRLDRPEPPMSKRAD